MRSRYAIPMDLTILCLEYFYVTFAATGQVREPVQRILLRSHTGWAKLALRG
ncbi:hypothetical protein [Coleofasciculus sp. FACHB-1120]|uniref:hypothetical protein n=1 Tax=Coleofasciculus sp. FACHB-1120 TaxID=2692783 RepID=UPI0016869DAA|nr:hypothetical protein [Coleofasciculus sp. FACHB-1120]MBD2742929.1 hypothetical protein [Coleofasciculus sp. FACHB-1120]